MEVAAVHSSSKLQTKVPEGQGARQKPRAQAEALEAVVGNGMWAEPVQVIGCEKVLR